jgi:hypothetical protein
VKLAVPAVLAVALMASFAAGEPAPSAAPVLLAFPSGTTTFTHEGLAHAGEPVELVLAPVPDGVIEARLLAKEGEIEMSIFRDDAVAPEDGTEPASGAVGWISAGAGARRIRFVVRAAAVETPFRLTFALRPAEPPAAE